MPDFNKEEKDRLLQFVIRLNNKFAKEVDEPVREAINHRPVEFEQIFNELKNVMDHLRNLEINNDMYTVDESTLPILKSTVDNENQEESNRLQAKLKNAIDLNTINELKKPLIEIEAFRSQNWYKRTQRKILPELRDYLKGERWLKRISRKTGKIIISVLKNPWTIAIVGGLIVGIILYKFFTT